MGDRSLDSINKKTWDKTKGIMNCCVINFLCVVGLVPSIIFSAPMLLYCGLFIMALFTSMMAVHFCWELEDKF